MIEHDKQCKVCVALLARKLQKEESTTTVLCWLCLLHDHHFGGCSGLWRCYGGIHNGQWASISTAPYP